MTRVRLPVYLVHWNAPEWCRSACNSIQASENVDIDLTVIDNSPDDGEALSSLLPSTVQVAVTGENLGFAGGANVGLRRWLSGSSEFCVIGSHDLHVEVDTFNRLLAAATAHPDFGVLGPTLGGPGTAAGGEWTGRRARHLRLSADESRQDVVDREFVQGMCMLLRRHCVEEVDGFDARFGSYVEDVDLCLRASDAGWRVGVVPGARAHDLGRAEHRVTQFVDFNSVLLCAKRGGMRAVAAPAFLATALAARTFAAGLAPWRPAARRRASLEHAADHARASMAVVAQRRLVRSVAARPEAGHQVAPERTA